MAGKYLKSIQIINDNLQITINDNIDKKYITHIKYKQHFNIDFLISTNENQYFQLFISQ